MHWTGAPHRLQRQLTTRFGTRAYAAEELIAELGAAFVLATLRLARHPHPQHAAYLASWLPLLRDDPIALATAAAHAARAADHLFQLPGHDDVIPHPDADPSSPTPAKSATRSAITTKPAIATIVTAASGSAA